MSLTPSDDESSHTLSVPVSLDDDGFLRRECPHCVREFKWLPSDDSEPTPADGYHCPYCNVQADGDSWFTRPQLEYLRATAVKEFVEPMLDDFADSMGGINRSGGLLRVHVERSDSPEPVKPHEPNDMRRVDFACHAKEPVKVLDDWGEAVYCLICGRAAS